MLLLVLHIILSASAQASVAEPQSAWKKKSVKVCWGSPLDAERADLPKLSKLMIEHSEYESFTSSDKRQVQETITREYNLKNTGIELVGWEDCEESDSSEVIVFSEDLTKPPKHLTDLMFVASYHGCSSIGDESPGSLLKRFVHIKKLPDYQLKLTSAQALDVIALHEFGHLVGLRHEHARRLDAMEDPNCYTQGIGLIEAMGTSAKLYSVYDPNSIMNYCHAYSLMNKTGNDFYVDDLSDVSLRVGGGQYAFGPSSVQFKFSPNDVNFTDDALVTKAEDQALKAIRFEVKIGLSKSDRHALKCMYDSTYDQQNCSSDYRP